MNMGSMLRNLHISPSSGFFLKIVGFTFIRGILKYFVQDIHIVVSISGSSITFNRF